VSAKNHDTPADTDALASPMLKRAEGARVPMTWALEVVRLTPAETFAGLS
jgi:hypothetical protein